jgi:aspartate-semialdehyde dehydrogenase
VSAGLRIAIAGATGTLGSELLTVLDEDELPVADLRLFASDASLGRDIEFQGQAIPVEVGEPELAGLDLLILCTPAAASLEWIRRALHAELPCIDCSGALAGASDVPMVIADLGAHDRVSGAPLITMPTGPALACALVLSALQGEAGLERVMATVLHSASSAGRRGIEELSSQTLALLNQRPAPDSDVFPGPVAFDCLPHPPGDEAEAGKDGAALSEARLAAALRRLLGPEVGLGITSVQVPAFAGEGTTLSVQTGAPLSLERARALLEAAPGVDLREDDPCGPTLREALGFDEVLVSRLRVDPSAPDGSPALLMWLAADPVRLAAANAVKLARARFSIT